MIESLSGGVKFPDGSVQTTAGGGLSTGLIDGSTGSPSTFFDQRGTWTSLRTGLGEYRITVKGMFTGGVQTKKPPAMVVTAQFTGAATSVIAYIEGLGSAPGADETWFFIKTVRNGVVADSDFAISFVQP